MQCYPSQPIKLSKSIYNVLKLKKLKMEYYKNIERLDESWTVIRKKYVEFVNVLKSHDEFDYFKELYNWLDDPTTLQEQRFIRTLYILYTKRPFRSEVHSSS